MADTLAIHKSGSPSFDEMTMLLDIAFDRALARKSHVSDFVLRVNGFSGGNYRRFINNLVRLSPNPKYLEVGSWAGSTACAAMDRNVCEVVCIDNWSTLGGPKELFVYNTDYVRNDNIVFRYIEDDFRKVNTDILHDFGIYLFDGPHEENDQFDGLHLYRETVNKSFYFIVDDWNWEQVREGTLRAIASSGMRIDYSIEVRTTLDNSHPVAYGEDSDWHNGYFLSKLTKL